MVLSDVVGEKTSITIQTTYETSPQMHQLAFLLLAFMKNELILRTLLTHDHLHYTLTCLLIGTILQYHF